MFLSFPRRPYLNAVALTSQLQLFSNLSPKRAALSYRGGSAYRAHTMTFDSNGSTSRSQATRSFPWRLSLLGAFFLISATSGSGGSPLPAKKSPLIVRKQDASDQNYYANAHSYLQEPVEQLVMHIPELATIQFASDQQALPNILEKTGEHVDAFFRDIIDLTAHEEIIEEKLRGERKIGERLQTEDSYLILRRGSEMLGMIDEYRMDAKGNRLGSPGLNNGYFVTSNFALSLAYFSTGFQSESSFRYLGEQKVGSCDTYVVAFAQKPGEATVTMGLGVEEGRGTHVQVSMLLQGIAWVDKANFEIVELRTDLLAPRAEIRLDSLTTVVTFAQVQLPDLAKPLWLPGEVRVNARFTTSDNQNGQDDLNFRNEHHYSDYQRYRVSTKMIPEESKELAPDKRPAVDEDDPDPLFYANVHPYIAQTLQELAKQIPELRKIQPAPDPQALTEILAKTANNVDSFFHDVVDLIAQEKITQERSIGGSAFAAREQVRDNYLILRRAGGNGSDIVEYRMDSNGNPVDQAGLKRGYVVTVGFALTCNYLSTAYQPESTFRYLGDQQIGKQDTYVLAFAQKPGQASLFVTLSGRSGRRVSMLMQGIAWVDKSNFQIVRIRTDLLAPHPEVGIDGQTTEVTFNKVQLQDVATPLWLPSAVKVDLRFKVPDVGRNKFYELSYRNEHRYADYRRYRVSVKMMVPQQP